MTIDILMATYNGGKYLREQLDSIEAQTRKDWRLLARDDGSTDDTLKILEEYAARLNVPGQPEKLVIIRNAERGKDMPDSPHKRKFLPIIRNFGALMEYSKADGKADYAMFCDQDDYWHPDKIEKTLKEMHALEAAHGKDAPLLVHTNAVLVDGSGKPINLKGMPVADLSRAATIRDKQGTDPATTSFRNELVQCTSLGCTIMMNRKLVEKAAPIPDACRMHDMWVGLVAYGSGHRAYVQEPTMDYRQHQQNVMGGQHNRSLSAMYERVTSVMDDFVAQGAALEKRLGGEMHPARRDDVNRFLYLAEYRQPVRGIKMASEGYTRASLKENAALFGGTRFARPSGHAGGEANGR